MDSLSSTAANRASHSWWSPLYEHISLPNKRETFQGWPKLVGKFCPSQEKKKFSRIFSVTKPERNKKQVWGRRLLEQEVRTVYVAPVPTKLFSDLPGRFSYTLWLQPCGWLSVVVGWTFWLWGVSQRLDTELLVLWAECLPVSQLGGICSKLFRGLP